MEIIPVTHRNLLTYRLEWTHFKANVLEGIWPSSEKVGAVMNAQISLISLLELKEILNTLKRVHFDYTVKLNRWLILNQSVWEISMPMRNVKSKPVSSTELEDCKCQHGKDKKVKWWLTSFQSLNYHSWLLCRSTNYDQQFTSNWLMPSSFGTGNRRALELTSCWKVSVLISHS